MNNKYEALEGIELLALSYDKSKFATFLEQKILSLVKQDKMHEASLFAAVLVTIQDDQIGGNKREIELTYLKDVVRRIKLLATHESIAVNNLLETIKTQII